MGFQSKWVQWWCGQPYSKYSIGFKDLCAGYAPTSESSLSDASAEASVYDDGEEEEEEGEKDAYGSIETAAYEIDGDDDEDEDDYADDESSTVTFTYGSYSTDDDEEEDEEEDEPTGTTTTYGSFGGKRFHDTKQGSAPPEEMATTATAEAEAEATTESSATAATTTTAVSAPSGEVSQPSSTCTTIIDLAQQNSDLSILVQAVQAAGLAEALSDPTLVATVLAPTNDAFEALAAQLGLEVGDFLDPERVALLATVLQYHAVPGVAATSDDLTDGQSLTTLNDGETITVQKSGSDITLVPSLAGASSAAVIQADLIACDAIVHVIDGVLLPANIAGADTGATASSSTAASPTSE